MIYDFNATTIDGKEVSLSKYKGKVLLIFNSATGCGFTPQYEGLEKLYETYKDKGLELLDFPSNEFGNQAKGSNEEIKSFCSLNYDIKFDQFQKTMVNGKNANPLFKYLKSQRRSMFGTSIKWNFTKFLVDKNGKVVKRYAPTTTPDKIEKDLVSLL
jgi:glutathione peroxidase